MNSFKFIARARWPANLMETYMETWTADEENAFAEVMAAGRMDRISAIRLFRRSAGNLGRALAIATAEAPTDEEIARRKAFGDSARLRAAQRRNEASLANPERKIAGRAVLDEGNATVASIEAA